MIRGLIKVALASKRGDGLIFGWRKRADMDLALSRLSWISFAEKKAETHKTVAFTVSLTLNLYFICVSTEAGPVS